jgi:hypothetical protein
MRLLSLTLSLAALISSSFSFAQQGTDCQTVVNMLEKKNYELASFETTSYQQAELIQDVIEQLDEAQKEAKFFGDKGIRITTGVATGLVAVYGTYLTYSFIKQADFKGSSPFDALGIFVSIVTGVATTSLGYISYKQFENIKLTNKQVDTLIQKLADVKAAYEESLIKIEASKKELQAVRVLYRQQCL